MRGSLLWLVVGLLLLLPTASLAGGEHQRRFAVELALIAGDSRLLLEEGLSLGKRAWIEARITSEHNLLPLLARHYLQEVNSDDPGLLQAITELQQQEKGSATLHQAAMDLSRRFPVQFAWDIKRPLDAVEKGRAADSFRQMCLGCHLVPAPDKSVVIGNLGRFARAMSREEWLARLIGGLRGDRYTGLENPFTDTQIALFFLYIRDELP